MKRKASHESPVTSHPGPLSGRGIVVTRPARQAERLASLIRAAGGEAIRFPVIEIRDVEDPSSLHHLIDRLEEFDLAVFISPNAANKGIAQIRSRRALPAGLAVAAVGPGTARELSALGVPNVTAPRGRGDSESLLELPQLTQAHGKRVVIFRGEGGRELLAEALAARGALVEHAVCYRRGRPALDPAPLLVAWASGRLAAITATSSEGLRNLCEMVGAAGRTLLVATPVFVTHPRIGQTAREHGMAKVIVTAGPGDEALLVALIQFFKGVSGDS